MNISGENPIISHKMEDSHEKRNILRISNNWIKIWAQNDTEAHLSFVIGEIKPSSLLNFDRTGA